MDVLHKLAHPALKNLASALATGRIGPPFSAGGLESYLPHALRAEVANALNKLAATGMSASHIATVIGLLAEERLMSQAAADCVELVWSGIEVEGTASRDTSVVVQELFREAVESVLVSSFAIDKGDKAEHLFGPLAKRMDEDTALAVRFYVNVPRKFRDETPDSVVLRQFADTFRKEIWPGKRMPEVYHDPRSLEIGGAARACLHAKCIVVDEARALISSANFTEAAQERNIEAGVLVADRQIARALVTQFRTLVERGMLRRVPGL